MNNRLLSKILVILSITGIGLGAGAIAIIEGKSFEVEKTQVSLKVTGSSTVYPLWTKAQDRLLTDIDNYSVNVEVTSTGSGNGVKDAKAGESDFGNASRNPKSSDSEAGTGWENMRTVKLAIDALSMYVHVPAACNDTAISTTPNNIVKAYTGLTNDNLNSLSSATGNIEVNSTGNQVSITRGQATISINSKNTQMSILTNSQCTENVVLYGRNTTASGTRDGFLKIADKTTDQNLTWLDDDVFDEILEARKQAGQIDTTNEANSAAVQAVEASSGGASYISYGFVYSKDENVGDDNLSVPTIDFGNGQIKPNTNNILSNSYDWTRNLNTIFDVRNTKIKSMELVLDFFRKGSGRAIVREAGFIPISITEAEATISYIYTDIELKENGETIPWLA